MPCVLVERWGAFDLHFEVRSRLGHGSGRYLSRRSSTLRSVRLSSPTCRTLTPFNPEPTSPASSGKLSTLDSPRHPPQRRPYAVQRRVINESLWHRNVCAPWPDILDGYGPWRTCGNRLIRWERSAAWTRCLQELQVVADLQDDIDRAGAPLDSTHVRIQRSAVSLPTTYSRQYLRSTPQPWATRKRAPVSRVNRNYGARLEAIPKTEGC